MSNDEYMKNVRWTTALYALVSTVSIVVSLCGMYWALKGDILQSRTESKEQIIAVSTAIKKTVDSTQHFNELQFQAIWSEIKDLKGLNKTTSASTVRKRTTSGLSYYIEKYVDGKLTFIKVK